MCRAVCRAVSLIGQSCIPMQCSFNDVARVRCLGCHGFMRQGTRGEGRNRQEKLQLSARQVQYSGLVTLRYMLEGYPNRWQERPISIQVKGVQNSRDFQSCDFVAEHRGKAVNLSSGSQEIQDGSVGCQDSLKTIRANIQEATLQSKVGKPVMQ